MSRLRVQQTQISGSLAAGYSDSLEAGIELVGQETLVGDLNALRSQLNKVIGEGNWYDALAGGQDLSDIHGAMQVTGADAAFQGDVSSVGDLSALGGDFEVVSVVSGGSTPESGYLGYGGFSIGDGSMSLSISGLVTSAFSVGNVVAAYDASDWSIPPQYRTVSNASYDVGRNSTNVQVSTPFAPISGGNAVVAVVGIASPTGASYSVTPIGVSTSTLTMTGSIKISGDTAQRLYIVGADGEIKDESGLTYDGSALLVSGSFIADDATLYGNVTAIDGTYSGDLSAVSGSFSGDISASAAVFSSDVTVSGDFSGVNATVSGQLSSTADGEIYFSVDAATEVDPALLSMGGDGLFEGNLTANGDFTSGGTVSAATGSFGPLTASGDITAVNGTVTAATGSFGPLTASTGSFEAVSISGDIAQRLYIVDADGSIKDEANLTYDGSELAVTGNAAISGELSAAGGDFSVAAGQAAGTAEAGYLGYPGIENGMADTMAIKIPGNHLGSGINIGDSIALYNSLDWTLPPVYLTVSVYSEYNGVWDWTTVAFTTSAGVQYNVAGQGVLAVVGNPAPAGASVLIDTAVASPAVLSMTGSIKIEGDVAQRLYIVGADGEIKDESGLTYDGSALTVSGSITLVDSVGAANDLSLAANGESVGLMSAADFTLFDSNFSATSIVGALNELYAAGAGGAAKGNLVPADVDAITNVLDFSAVGTLNSADHKFIDVYLNGVLLAPEIDVTAVAVDNVTLAANIVSELGIDDVFTVVLRGAASS